MLFNGTIGSPATSGSILIISRIRALRPLLRHSGRRNYQPPPCHASEPLWIAPQVIKGVWSDTRDCGLTVEDFEGPRYVRLGPIQRLVRRA